MSDVKCPYGGYEQEIEHGGSYSYTEDIDHEYQCREFGDYFNYRIYIYYQYETECLEGDHKFDEWIAHGSGKEYRKCIRCDHTEWREIDKLTQEGES